MLLLNLRTEAVANHGDAYIMLCNGSDSNGKLPGETELTAFKTCLRRTYISHTVLQGKGSFVLIVPLMSSNNKSSEQTYELTYQ